MSINNRKLSRQFVVNKKFQTNFLSHFVVVAVFQVIVQVGLIMYFHSNFNSMLDSIGVGPDDAVYVFLQSQSQFLLYSSLIANCLFTTTLIAVGLNLSQRVAGPIQKAVDHLQNPEPKGQLAFRSNDFFPELASAINKKAH